MTKLPHNSMQNIKRTEIKALLKEENKAISGFSDFVRDYVWDVLKGKKENLRKKILKWWSEKFEI